MYFRGEYWFLSNFYSYRLRDMEYPSITYISVEAAFQAAKAMTYEERKAFSELSPQEAKRMGRRIPLRPDWESVKEKVMETYLRQKFSVPTLRKRLKAIEGPIVEDNTWGDTYWGRTHGRGLNRLGVLLEKIRAEI